MVSFNLRSLASATFDWRLNNKIPAEPHRCGKARLAHSERVAAFYFLVSGGVSLASRGINLVIGGKVLEGYSGGAHDWSGGVLRRSAEADGTISFD